MCSADSPNRRPWRSTPPRSDNGCDPPQCPVIGPWKPPLTAAGAAVRFDSQADAGALPGLIDAPFEFPPGLAAGLGGMNRGRPGPERDRLPVGEPRPPRFREALAAALAAERGRRRSHKCPVIGPKPSPRRGRRPDRIAGGPGAGPGLGDAPFELPPSLAASLGRDEPGTAGSRT